jgi:tetratricopeptide (TPR) repeat protein
MAMREAEFGRLDPQVSSIAEWYAKLLRKTNRLPEATELEKLVKHSRAKYGADWSKYSQAGMKAQEEENYFIAQAMWLAALDEARDFPNEDPRLSASLENLAEVYWKQLKYDRIEPLCKRILQISENVLGKEHPDVAAAANNMALVCERQGKHAEATMLYQQALSINEKLYGQTHPDVLAGKESLLRARTMAQKQVEIKAKKEQDRWKKSGWWQAYQREADPLQAPKSAK